MIASPELDGIKCRIRLVEKLGQRHICAGIECIPDGHGKIMRFTGKAEILRLCRKGLDLVQDLFRRSILHENDELIATVAPDDVILVKGSTQFARQRPERFIAGRMAMEIIDELESIDIDADQCPRGIWMMQQPILDARSSPMRFKMPVRES